MDHVAGHTPLCIASVELECEEKVAEFGRSIGNNGHVGGGARTSQGLQVQLRRVGGWIPVGYTNSSACHRERTG